jgi:undecaprenyl diphosphate synthase
MLDLLNLLKKKEKVSLRHIAISVKGVCEWSAHNAKGDEAKRYEEALQRRNNNIKSIIKFAIDSNIPIITFDLKSECAENSPEYAAHVESLNLFFKSLMGDELIHKNKVKISVIGKWYSLPGMLVETIKSMIDRTKEYDHFFLNFCVRYSGQEEIIDAFRLVYREMNEATNELIQGKKEWSEKDEEENNKKLFTIENIKENAYSSYFVPPDIILETGKDHRYSGLLLWDAVHAKIFFIEKLFPDVEVSDVEEILEKG